VRVGFAELLQGAAAEGRAAGAITCYDAGTAAGVLAAAAERDTGVVLLLAPAAFAAPGGDLLARALAAMADGAAVPACLQLDHATELAAMVAAAACGVGAVLADGSRLGLEANAARVSAARAELPASVGVEAELGHVAGDEDVAIAARQGRLTDPDDAARFVAATGADCLAVSVGNVHGAYAAPPALDWSRLERIRERVDVPLALHGASGLPAHVLRRAIGLGVAKVNVNTEIRERQFALIADRLHAWQAGARMLELTAALRAVAHDVTRRLLTTLDPRELLPE